MTPPPPPNQVSMGLAASSTVPSPLSRPARIANLPFLLTIKVYRVLLSPFVGRQCRFEPTCSKYAAEAYRLYGPIPGSKMTLSRIARCHPWNPGGFDPVPIPEHHAPQETDTNGQTTSSTEA